MTNEAIRSAAGFGPRTTPSGTPGFDNAAPEKWPFVSKNNALNRSLPIMGGIALICATQIAPTILKSRSIDSFFQQNGAFDLILIFALIALIIVIFRRRLTLTIDQEGIVSSSGRATWQYGWRDIEGTAETRNSIRLVLKGRTEIQNRYNLLPASVGLSKRQLAALVAYGVANCKSSSNINTVAQGDDIKRTQKYSLNLISLALGITFSISIAISANIAFGSAYDASRLQASGVKTTAKVTRFFTGSCNKGRCDVFADYIFFAHDPQTGQDKSYIGSVRVGSDDEPNDPDLLAAKATSTLPIAYDRGEPSFSRENLRNLLFAPHPWRTAFVEFGIMVGMMTVVLGGIWMLAYAATRKRQVV